MTRAALAAAIVLAGAAAHAADHAVILMYHRFGEDRFPSTSVTLEQFDAHLAHLADAGYTVVSLSDVIAAIGGKTQLPDRAVAITVDDAFASVHAEAFPRLKARGWPFTVFVSTDAVDEGLAAYMSWDQLREMRDAGVRLANHTATHDSLIERREGETDAAWRKRIDADLDRAARRLQEEVGDTPPHFAYPYGEYDTVLAETIRARGWSAVGQQSGAVGSFSDTRALPRFPMAESFAAIGDFETKVATLPFAIAKQDPWEPVTTERRPRLEVALAEAPKRIGELACYVTGQGQVEVEWIEPGKRFAVRAAKDLSKGRGRYNCTAPSVDGRRYHWFSQQWIVR